MSSELLEAEGAATDGARHAKEGVSPALSDAERAEIEAEVAAIDVGDYPRTDDERVLLQYLRRRAQLHAEVERITTCHEKLLKELNDRLSGLDFVYQPLAERLTRIMLIGSKAKSVKTPFGTCGFRMGAGHLEVLDEQQVLDAINRGEIAREAVELRTELHLDKAKLSEWFKQRGEVPPGCQYVAPQDKFYVK